MSPESESAVQVEEIDLRRRRARRRFVSLPFELARDHPMWQPGLFRLAEDTVHPGRNPFWARFSGSFFLARVAGRVRGRIAVIEPGQIPEHPDAAVIAFPDFVDDPAVPTALFRAVDRRAASMGAARLIGPLNPDIHHDVGIQIEGHDRRNAVFMGYQPAYYGSAFDASGFRPLMDFDAWGLYRDWFDDDGRLRRLASRVERDDALRIRPVDLTRYDEELALFHRLYCRCFEDHWGFSEPTWDEFRFVAGDMKHILRPEMALVAEWRDEPVGFVLGVPDLHSILPDGGRGRLTPGTLLGLLRKWRSVDEARVMIAGVLPAHRARGIHLPLFYRIAAGIFEAGFRGGEISWVLSGNSSMARALPLLGARRVKRYRIYTKPVHQ